MPRGTEFADLGYLGPVRVLSKRECRRLLREPTPEPLDWMKDLAVSSRAYYDVATRPEILGVVSELLGGRVILWGASAVDREPGAVHHWHTDIECSAPEARTVSVWIGLEHTTPKSALVVIPRSHRFGAAVQEIRARHGVDREQTTADDLLRWAREHEPQSELVPTRVHDGEAIFFDGKLWHGTHNVSRRTRRALLLQYATPETPIRIPDLTQLDWPFRQFDEPRPACLLLRGDADPQPNRIVPGPVFDHGVVLTSRIHALRLPLEGDAETGWRAHPAFAGSTAGVPSLSCHASVLAPGHSPHPPHAHDEEEVLLLLDGEVELVWPRDERVPLQPGQFAYYPAGFRHTLRTTSASPANYVMLKWRGEPGRRDELAHGRFDSALPGVLFDQETRYLRKLQAHVTVLGPGGGYDAHADAYDVAIVLLEGEVETIGGRAAPHDVIFYRAGEPHGMRNVGAGAARYVVFEFHS